MELIHFDGKKFAQQKTDTLKARVQKLNVKPQLVWIQIGQDPASSLYGKLKGNAAQTLGITFQKVVLEDSIDAATLQELVEHHNNDDSVHGVMVQLPIFINQQRPDQELRTKILGLIDPRKDVDCLTPTNLGNLMSGSPAYIPATVSAIIQILEQAAASTSSTKYIDWLRGKQIAIIGGGLEVGRPLANQLSNTGAIIVWARSSAQHQLQQLTNQADVVISAVGSPNLITGEMIKSGAIIIDVASPQGDFEYDTVSQKASFITKVPGGVGPVTVSCLMENTITAAENAQA